MKNHGPAGLEESSRRASLGALCKPGEKAPCDADFCHGLDNNRPSCSIKWTLHKTIT